MKKNTRRAQSNTTSNAVAKNGDGRWEFTSSGRLFTLGSDSARRAAYRGADGELRLLPPTD